MNPDLCWVCGHAEEAHTAAIQCPPLHDGLPAAWCYEFRSKGDDVQRWVMNQSPDIHFYSAITKLQAMHIPLTAPIARWESDVRRVLAGMFREKA